MDYKQLIAEEEKIMEQEELGSASATSEAYEKTKAECETKAMMDVAQDTQKTLAVKINQRIAEHIDTNQEVSKRIDDTANKLVEKGLQAEDNKATASVTRSEDEINEADFEKHSSEYLYHGIDHKLDKDWKRKMLLVINDIWFVIWAIISAFTIVPVSTFLSRIKALSGLVKMVAILVGIGMVLVCLGGLTYGCLKWTGVI